jgi:hypothetical protein
LPGVVGPFVVGLSGVERVGPLQLERGGQLQGVLANLPEDAGETMVNLFGQDGITQNAPIVVPASADGRWSSPLLPPGRYRITARVISGSPPTPKTAGTEHTVMRGEATEVKLVLN